MKKRSHVLLASLIFVMLVFCSGSSKAQSDGYLTNSNLRGVVPASTYDFGTIDNVNVATGAVNLQIPLFSRPGRKLTDTGIFFYSSKLWMVVPNWDPSDPSDLDSVSWMPTEQPNAQFSVAPGGSLDYQSNSYSCVINNVPLTTYVASNFVYTSASGGTYQFPNGHWWNSDGSNPDGKRCSGIKFTNYDVATSSSGVMQLNTTQFPTTAIVTDRTGKQTVFSNYGATVKYEDTNGNYDSMPSPTVEDDTLDRTITYSTNLNQMTLVDPTAQGGSKTYSYQYSFVNVDTDFPTAKCNAAPFYNYTYSVKEVSSLTLPNSWTYTFTYDPQFGDLTKVTLPSGGYIRYDYTVLSQADNGPQNINCKLDSRRVAHRYVSPTGTSGGEQTWTYTYSPSNDTTTVTDPSGNQVVHTFSAANLTTEVETQYSQLIGNSLVTLKTVNNTWLYDSGPVQAQQNSYLAVCDTMNWRLTGSLTTLNDTSQESQVTTAFDSYSYSAPFTNCGTSLTTSYMNPTQVETFDYGNGSYGNLLKRTNYTYLYSNSTYLNLFMVSQVASTIVYDSTSNQCEGASKPCAQTDYEYDNYTKGISSSGGVQHDSTFNTNYTTRGNVTATENWRSTDGAWLTARNQYDDAGNIISSQDPNQVQGGQSGQTTYSYSDSWSDTTCKPTGGSAKAYLTSVTNALNYATSYTYNSCQGSTASTTDPNSQSTTSTYDYMVRLKQENFPDGGQTSYSYNDTSTPLSITSTQLMSQGQNLVNATILDGLGRISETEVTSVTPNVDTETYYDAIGRVSEVTNPFYSGTSSPTDGNTQYQYDVLDRVTEVIAQDGGTTTTTHLGNCATSTDPVGNARKSCTDAIGRLTQVFEDPVNSNYETDYAYDALSDLIQVQQKGGTTNSSQWRTRTFAYDSVSELLCANNPEIGTTPCPIPDNGSYTAGTVRYSYDYDGNVLTKVSPAPNQTIPSTTVTLTYSYDALDRLLQKTSSDGTIGSYYLYDTADTNGVVLQNPIGRLSRSNTSVVESLYSYDPMGRVLEDMQTTPMHNQMAFLLTYTYDFIGDMTSYTNGMGYQFNQVFDPAARLTQVTTNYVDSPSTIAQSFTYAPTGAITGMSYGTNNVVAETRAYNNRLQTTQIWTYLTSTQTSVQNNSIGYSGPNGQNNGNVYLWDFYSAYDGGIGASPRTYTYDRLNRLSSLSSSGDTSGCYGLNWTYDPWGNRTGQTTTPGTGGSCPNFNATFSQNTNRMDTYSYDAAGNLLNDGTNSYTYDAENHIIKVDGGSTATYTYDADGRRVEKTNSQGTTDKIYDLSGNVIADWQATGQMQGGWSVGYLYLAGRLAATFENSTTYFVGTDHLGSARGLVNANGTIVDGYHYLPFGELLQGGTYTTHKFTGYERDSETNLDNAQARYYGSSMGRLMSPDPGNAGADSTNPQSWNAYSYVLNNPLILIDPAGLDCVYLDNSGGTDPDGPGGASIDSDSNLKDCQSSQGYWADGHISSLGDVSTFANNNNALIFSTVSGITNVTLASQTTSQGGFGLGNYPDSFNSGQFWDPSGDNSDSSQDYMQAISMQLAPLGKLSDCAGRAAANQIPLGSTIFGTPKAPSDHVGTALNAAGKLSNPKNAGRVAYALNKAGLPMLSETAGKGLAKAAGTLLPYAGYISGANAIWTGYQFVKDTAGCYNKPPGS
jgi:RHS repeat-associated protein